MASNLQPPTANLTTATRFGRLFVKYGTVTLVSLMVGRMLLVSFVAYWKATHPEPPPPPTIGFGVLPALTFPEKKESERPTSYKLETGLGSRLPEFDIDRAKVFLMPKSIASLLADKEVKEVAATYGFIFEPQLLDSRTYRWTKTGALDSSLEIDTQNKTFLYKTNYLSKPELITNTRRTPEEYEAVRRLKSFLDKTDLLADDIATSSGDVVFLKSIGGELEEAFSLSDADFIQVNLDRTMIDEEYEMYNPEPENGVVTAIISGVLSGQESIVDLEYHYKPVDYEQMETYPVRSAKSAWQVLQSGNGFVAEKGTSQEAVIRDVDIGYYEDWDNEQEYLQPIYVFTGDNGFVGYVSAIDTRYINEEN
ncbi:MAG: hypothetical protein HN981_00460 [Candidatus Pacebacteria bacterium]|jgi:hypothetical protein|nr:hypothetical protein [Candidatus Paceibacterota bacterium]MBT4651930.1 hypothetical protein [Candidatus Paceibacterota bacterium]MBT6755952.1 hypothetical protein [Candidatus Paceibacterota bacterium]MBT6920855.1 hypothetical protein [Candidatus Paceibacterota bacterium]